MKLTQYIGAIGRLSIEGYINDERIHAPREAALMGEVSIVLGEHNSERLPAYIRLDLGYRGNMVRRMFGRDVALAPYIQVLHVLGNRNVVTGAPQYDGFLERGRIEYFPALPTLPTFGIEWKF